MNFRGRWVVVGLLCACSTIGCAALPSRGLFTRRPKPAATKEIPATAADEDWDERELASTDRSAGSSRKSDSENSGGGMFDVSSVDSSANRAAAVEAPAPKRRGTVEASAEPRPPNPFVPPDNARELRPESPRNPIELVGGVLNDQGTDAAGGVVTADEVQSASGGYSTDIELAGGQRSARNGTSNSANPWDRFRNLAGDLDADGLTAESSPANAAAASADRSSTSAGLPPADWQRQSPSLPGPSAASGPQAFAPIPMSSAAPRDPNAPELWPQAPGAIVPPAPNQVQWVHAEQSAIGGATTPYPLPSSPNTQMLAPTASGPPNLAFPDNAVAVTPFATSPELDRLITQTTVEAAALTPGDHEIARQLYLRKHVQLRLLHLIAGQMDRALQPVPGIDPADQEFWQQMLWSMANYFDTQGMPDSAERAAQTIAPLQAAAARLQEKARLQLHNVAFCHKISGYGNYQRFRRDDFTPGHPVLLYAEVSNFKSELLADGQFRTLLKSTLEILEGGPAGRVIETLPLMPSEDRCRNQRRDYYHSYEFTIPQSCNPGPHTLRLRVEDQLGKKVAETSVNFTVQ